mmetsp:Transcript_118521/g.342703  ORF Transcript_118521/g.342703 Transcript_118521/m.342703 type:complete len:515 (-) Transcript_118521:615-2159(-)
MLLHVLHGLRVCQALAHVGHHEGHRRDLELATRRGSNAGALVALGVGCARDAGARLVPEVIVFECGAMAAGDGIHDAAARPALQVVGQAIFAHDVHTALALPQVVVPDRVSVPPVAASDDAAAAPGALCQIADARHVLEKRAVPRVRVRALIVRGGARVARDLAMRPLAVVLVLPAAGVVLEVPVAIVSGDVAPELVVAACGLRHRLLAMPPIGTLARLVLNEAPVARLVVRIAAVVRASLALELPCLLALATLLRLPGCSVGKPHDAPAAVGHLLHQPPARRLVVEQALPDAHHLGHGLGITRSALALVVDGDLAEALVAPRIQLARGLWGKLHVTKAQRGPLARRTQVAWHEHRLLRHIQLRGVRGDVPQRAALEQPPPLSRRRGLGEDLTHVPGVVRAHLELVDALAGLREVALLEHRDRGLHRILVRALHLQEQHQLRHHARLDLGAGAFDVGDFDALIIAKAPAHLHLEAELRGHELRLVLHALATGGQGLGVCRHARVDLARRRRGLQ